MNILNSASKIVFILLALALAFLTYVHIVEPKDFIMLCAMAFTYYFTKPPAPSVTTTTDDGVTTKSGTVDSK